MSGWASNLPVRDFKPRRYPTRETEITTVWNDGTVVKTNRFGEVEHHVTKPVPMDALMQAFFEALDGRVTAPAEMPAAGAKLVDWDSGDLSL